MLNVVLIIHLIIALCLIAAVLLQRSEGGALGIGGGGGGLVSARGAETALSKLTWALAIGFLTTSVILTILAGGREDSSVFDTLAPAGESGGAGDLPLPDLSGEGLLPGAADDGGQTPTAPETPPAAD